MVEMTAIDTALRTPQEIRAEVAAEIKKQKDVSLPRMKAWNYEACSYHEAVGPQPDCEWQRCGGELFNYQRVGVAWAYVAKRGLLGDDPGLGKTGILLGLIALLKHKGELNNRACVMVQTPAVLQWLAEAQRWLPGVHVEIGLGALTQKDRIGRYASNWDLLVVGHHVAMNDRKYLASMAPFSLFASDDVDPLLDPTNVTHQVIVEMAESAERSFTINATTLQTHLEQLHAALVPSGGLEVFGGIDAFDRKYVRYANVHYYDPAGRRKTRKKQVGYKNLLDLKAKLSPMYLRRRVDDVDDGNMPVLMPPSVVWLEMSPQQKALYAALRQGVLELRRTSDGVSYMASQAMFTSGQMICAGLPAVGEPDGPGASPKLDWCMTRLTSNWTDRKVIFFLKNPSMVGAFQARCAAAGIGSAKIVGGQDAVLREQERIRFWEDPKCRVMMGTTALERSLNLQVANTVVAVDTHLNWARMKQIVGRGRRRGSKHKHMWMFTLLMSETQEDGYLKVLSQRQALNDSVFEEETGMYAKLSPTELLMLIVP